MLKFLRRLFKLDSSEEESLFATAVFKVDDLELESSETKIKKPSKQPSRYRDKKSQLEK